MIASTRVRLLRGDARWEHYFNTDDLYAPADPTVPGSQPMLISASRNLDRLAEVRSIDSGLNGYAPHGGAEECDPLTLAHALGEVPPPTSEREYVQLVVNRDGPFADFTPEGFALLGHDLADETLTSSLLNCGFDVAAFAAFDERLNAVGLLSLDDARAAQAVLWREYPPGMSHADTDVWAIFELLPEAARRYLRSSSASKRRSA
jgi:hypothetical protein